MAASSGSKINPFSVTFSRAQTVSEFTTFTSRVELRRGVYKNALWCWIRVTVKERSYYQLGSSVKLSTPAGVVKDLPYGSGSNWDVGAVRCTAAICLGQPASFTTVTYSGVAVGDNATKTARVI